MQRESRSSTISVVPFNLADQASQVLVRAIQPMANWDFSSFCPGSAQCDRQADSGHGFTAGGRRSHITKIDMGERVGTAYLLHRAAIR